MSGLLSGILTAVAIVATVMTGGALGIVAGALMAMSYASSKGWIGGGVGKFFNSSTGHYLTMAVGLASAATSLYGAMTAPNAAAAATSQSSTVAAANTAAEGSSAAAGAGDAAAAGGDMASGSAALQAGTDTLNAAPTVSGSMAQTMTNGNQFAAGIQGGDSSLTAASGLQPSEIQAAQKAADISAQQSGLAGAGSNVTTGEVPTADQALGINTTQQTQAQGISAEQAAPNATTKGVGDLDPVNPNKALYQGDINRAAGAMNQANIDSTPTQDPGMLSKAGSFLKDNPSVAVAGGNMLSGMAQGAAQQKMMQEQIAAQQWGNMQWNDPTQVAKLQSSATAPIQVPVGYLNRAAAARSMVNGAAGQTAPLSGNAPAPMAPMALPTPGGAGPVPASAMPAVPRGGT